MAMCVSIVVMVMRVVTVIGHNVSLKGNGTEAWRPHPIMQVRLLLIGRFVGRFAL